MPAYAQSPRMRTISDNRNQLRFNRGINLNLHVAVIGIPIDVLNRLVRGVHPHFGRARKFSGAVDNPCFQNARAELGAIIETRDPLEKSIGVICHIARAGHAIGEIERAIVVTEMLVIVPQPRHQELIMRVDNLRVRSWFDVGARADAHNSLTANEHARCRCDAKIARIEQTRVTNDQVATRDVCKCAREALPPCSVGFLLRVAQLRDRTIRSIRHHRKPRRHGRGCAIMI